MSKRSIRRNIVRQQRRSKNNRGVNINPPAPTVTRMTYQTTFWKTPDGKKRSKTELVSAERTKATTP